MQGADWLAAASRAAARAGHCPPFEPHGREPATRSLRRASVRARADQGCLVRCRQTRPNRGAVGAETSSSISLSLSVSNHRSRRAISTLRTIKLSARHAALASQCAARIRGAAVGSCGWPDSRQVCPVSQPCPRRIKHRLCAPPTRGEIIVRPRRTALQSILAAPGPAVPAVAAVLRVACCSISPIPCPLANAPSKCRLGQLLSRPPALSTKHHAPSPDPPHYKTTRVLARPPFGPFLAA